LIPAVEAALARADEIKKLRNSELSLTTALDAGRATSMAVGVMMERHRISRVAAFDRIRSEARSSRRKISEIANELLELTEGRNPD
jgi:AmiR/NasT family two-component response regulator